MTDNALIGAIFVLPFTVSYGGIGAALADARRRAAVLVLLQNKPVSLPLLTLRLKNILTKDERAGILHFRRIYFYHKTLEYLLFLLFFHVVNTFIVTEMVYNKFQTNLHMELLSQFNLFAV